ncbi:hypothetical protein MY8738_002554 [Beauveria namnaoensis]
MHPALLGYLTGTIAVSTVAASISTPQKPINPAQLDIPVTILADTNRDGLVDDLDTYGKHAWTTHHGAIFLPNSGDELHRCHVDYGVGTPLSNWELAACNDAAGDVLINSTLAAPVKTLPLADLSKNATARILVQPPSAAENVRLFWKHRNEGSSSDWALVKSELQFNSTALSAGLTLAIDARHLVTDKTIWDGLVNIKIEVTDVMRSGSDFVAIRQAPVLLHHHRQSMEAVQGAFVNTLGAIIHKLKPAVPLITLNDSRDIWAQDLMEPAFASMPGRNGPISIRVLLRSPQLTRPNGRLVFEQLRGAGVGGWQLGLESGFGWEEINSGGNIETIPLYTSRLGVSYKNGRVILGKHYDKYLAASLTKFLEAQREQTPLYLEAGWLFLPSNNIIGFRVAVPDTRSALRILKHVNETGHGIVPFLSFKGNLTDDNWPIFADHELPNKTKFIDRNVEILLEELPISDADVLRVPALWRDQTYDWLADSDGLPARLHHTIPGERQLQGFFPLAVNGLVLDQHYICPKPFGPRVDGVDVFEREIGKVYTKAGFNVVFIDDYMSHHVRGGEVHCGTNSLRHTNVEWWKTN